MKLLEAGWLDSHHHITGFKNIKDSTETNNIKRKAINKKYKNK